MATTIDQGIGRHLQHTLHQASAKKTPVTNELVAICSKLVRQPPVINELVRQLPVTNYFTNGCGERAGRAGDHNMHSIL